MRVHYPPSVRVRWRISADAKPYLSGSELICIGLFANMGCRNTHIRLASHSATFRIEALVSLLKTLVGRK